MRFLTKKIELRGENYSEPNWDQKKRKRKGGLWFAVYGRIGVSGAVVAACSAVNRVVSDYAVDGIDCSVVAVACKQLVIPDVANAISKQPILSSIAIQDVASVLAVYLVVA